ncbi:MAG: hypothetical protein HQK53_03835, partial [Oligoflexia bacterium]|nr:hypothetical protein [Oligoflexia bacterium]
NICNPQRTHLTNYDCTPIGLLLPKQEVQLDFFWYDYVKKSKESLGRQQMINLNLLNFEAIDKQNFNLVSVKTCNRNELDFYFNIQRALNESFGEKFPGTPSESSLVNQTLRCTSNGCTSKVVSVIAAVAKMISRSSTGSMQFRAQTEEEIAIATVKKIIKNHFFSILGPMPWYDLPSVNHYS